jgi:hypothetical protein
VRRILGLLVTGFVATSAAMGLVPAHASSWTSSSYASRLVQLVNQTRQQHGLGALTVTSGTSEVAAAWTAHLDAAQSLSHNPDLRHQLETHGSPDWTTYGENVGEGPADDPDALFKAYMNSTEHRANILNSAYRFTGVSVVLDGSTAWNTFDFVDTYHSTKQSSTTQVKPKPASSTSRPAPSAPASSTTAPAATPVTTAPSKPRNTAPAVKKKGAHRALPHTGARPQADALPNLADLLAAHAQDVSSRTSVLATAVHPLSPGLPASSRLLIAVAGLLVGFTSVRWWQVARAA